MCTFTNIYVCSVLTMLKVEKDDLLFRFHFLVWPRIDIDINLILDFRHFANHMIITEKIENFKCSVIHKLIYENAI